MLRQQFLEQVKALRREGKTIRDIAAELAVHRSKVQRALKALSQTPPQESKPSAHGAAGGVFVGRQREMAELVAALEDALAGRGRLVMLVGEPGIGKTRTSQQLAAFAERRGAMVLWGRCQEGAGAPPYWPWTQIIRSYVREQDVKQVRSEMGSGAAYIAAIVPELREELPDPSASSGQALKPPPGLDPESARFQLFDSITTFLNNASKRQPLLLILDNLHWADIPSMLLLEFLGQELAQVRIMALGTYRDTELSREHPLSRTLGELAREPLFHQVFLRGLAHGDVARFIRAISDIEPTDELVEAMHSRTEGNPLFMTHVARLLSEDASTGVGNDWNTLIPESVRAAIRRRLDRLPQNCVQVLTVASVIGREFGFDQLEKGLGRSLYLPSPLLARGEYRVEDMLEALDEALAGGIISEAPSAAGRYRFTHVLIKDTLFSELSAARRARLHGEVGKALEELYGSNVEAHAVELVHHFTEAQTVLGARKLTHYSQLAGEQALATYAYEDALAHFQRALGAKEGQPMDAETAALLFSLGRAQAATLERHQTQNALDTLTRAFDYYAEAGDAARAVSVAEHLVSRSAGLTRVNPLLTRALKLVPPDSHEAGRILSKYGRALGTEENDYEGAQDAFRRALAIAQREKDATLEMRTLADAATVDAQHLRDRDCLEKSLRAIELARRLDDLYVEGLARLWAVLSLLNMGNMEGAQPHAEANMALAERLRDRIMLENSLECKELPARLTGNWRVARAFSDRRLGVSPAIAFALGYRTMLEYEVGEFSQGNTYLERLIEAMRMVPPGPNLWYIMPAIVIPVVARITGDVSRFAVAEAAAQAVLSSPFGTPHRTTTARAGLALIAVQRGDVAAAGEQYAALLSRRGNMLTSGATFSADRVLGLLAQTIGQLDKAVEHFEAALAFCRKAGYRPELAWTCHDYAMMLFAETVGALRQVGAPLQSNATNLTNREKALALLDEALSISTELGMRPLLEKATTLRQSIKAQPSSAPKYPADLTERQAEVLQLIAEGKTNREIAEQLVLSERTVQRHIADVYAKIGARNRAEATAFVLAKLAFLR